MADSPYRRSVAVGATAMLLTSAVVASSAGPAPAAAPDKTPTASNAGVITIHEQGAASPYPADITVPASRGVVTDVDVTLVGLDHTCMTDLDVILVSPTGRRATVISDAGNCPTNPVPLTLTFDDEAAGVLPNDTPLASRSYKPTDNAFFDPDIPASLAVFDGAPSSGAWSLYIYDQVGDDSGSLTGGWALDIDYNDSVAPTGSVVVDGGATLTDSQTATLTLDAADPSPGTGVEQMRFSDNGTTWSAFQPYAATATWSLLAGNGTRTVYVQFADAFGNLSAPASDSITLDTAAPKAKKLSPKKNAKDVSVKTKVSFVASESLDASTVTKKTVKLTAGDKTVKAKVAYSASKKRVTLKPAKNLKSDTKHKVKITSRVTDLAGNGFATQGWKFTTADPTTTASRATATTFGLTAERRHHECLEAAGASVGKVQNLTRHGDRSTMRYEQNRTSRDERRPLGAGFVAACDSEAVTPAGGMGMMWVRRSSASGVALGLALSGVATALGAFGATPAVAIEQTISMSVLPPIAQVGTTPSSPSSALTAVAVSVTPAVPGRTVRLDRLSGRTWVRAAETTVNSRGLAEFAVATYVSGAPVTYRATALSYQGAPKVVSGNARSTRWGAADFAEEFNGTALGGSWSHRGPDYNPVGLRKCSRGSPEAVQVAAGTVRLSVLRDASRTDRCTAYRANGEVIGDFDYRLNGHISTAGRQTLTYGVAAARMRFQQLAGQHAAFWLQPSSPLPGATSAAEGGAEIDVIEWFGADRPSGGLSGSVYYPTSSGQAKAGGWIPDPNSYLGGPGDSWWANYHVFSVEWSPEEYVFRIDGRETWRTSLGVSQQPEYLILSLLSSDYELPNLGGEDHLPQHMYVDWVQFWRSAN